MAALVGLSANKCATWPVCEGPLPLDNKDVTSKEIDAYAAKRWKTNENIFGRMEVKGRVTSTRRNLRTRSSGYVTQIKTNTANR